jgi:hypothetical protein
LEDPDRFYRSREKENGLFPRINPMKGQGGRKCALITKYIPRAVEMQIPYCHHPEVLKEDAIREGEKARGRGDKGSMPAARDRAGGRAPDAGPHVRKHPPKHSVAFTIGFIKDKSAV